MTETITLSPGLVDLRTLERVYRTNAPVRLDPVCRESVELSARIIADCAAGGDPRR